jgi:hypothetical protein
MKTAKALIEILRRAERRKRYGSSYFVGKNPYWPISSVAARRLLQDEFGPDRRLPRVGEEIEFPPTLYQKRKGYFTLSNHGGQYELTFCEDDDVDPADNEGDDE